MSFTTEYTTLEEYLELRSLLRSPNLQPSAPNFDIITTPPPFVDAPDDCESSDTEATVIEHPPASQQRTEVRPQFSLYDALLIRELGRRYLSEIAERAGTELPVESPDYPREDQLVKPASEHYPMVSKSTHQDMTSPSDRTALPQALTASKRASERLKDAIDGGSDDRGYPTYSHRHRVSLGSDYSIHSSRTKSVKVSIANLTNNAADDVLDVSDLTIQASPAQNPQDSVPLDRPVLPSLQISSAVTIQTRQRHDSLSESPTLARFTITPSDGHPSQTLAKLHNHQSPSAVGGQSPDYRQTLPSLETALNSVADFIGPSYTDISPGLPRPSPSPATLYGPSSAGYSQSTPTVAMSPPRFPINPASWRTLSNNSSNSNSSEYTSGQGSGTGSTPATRPSPSQSVSTPQFEASEQESNPDSDYNLSGNASQVELNPQPSTSTQQGYPCVYPGCTAPPFQTQYLLNSHTNVHSNQRPHFCPVEGCPRGPGGQGFKRKNEMIRHGLVHQSPGYVCPFCPDQQHKYPRPDNLQRHVRVHHVDRDKDDPLLRDVLAQRPEGGNRGRRRRMV